MKDLFREALNTFGTVDVLINNAGQSKATSFFESSKEDWVEAFSNNFFSTVLCSQQAAGIMKQRGSGKIINTASVRGLENTGRQGIMAYSAAKAAVINFTKTLAKELSPGITVNAVAPGFIATAMTEKIPEEAQGKIMARVPIGRMGTDLEVAHAVRFLASDDAAYITGHVLNVNGGLYM